MLFYMEVIRVMFLLTIIFLILNLISTIISVVFSLTKKSNFIIALLCSLTSAIGMQLSIYANINNWILKNDWTALMDVVPSMKDLLMAYIIIILVVNIASTIFFYKKSLKD